MKERNKKSLDSAAIGARLKSLRRHMGITQKEAADRCGTTSKHISEAERGVCSFSISMLGALCRLYRASADYILFGTEDTPKAQPWILEDYESLSQHDKDLLHALTETMVKKLKECS